ncbi:MAG: tocopherol cyclase family protein, partial [Turicibacter sp.]
WYFKIVDSSAKYALAFIPGIARGSQNDEHHSFIQVVNLIDNTYHYHRFSVDDFYSNPRHLKINVGINEFSFNKLFLNLDTEDESISGVLYFGHHTKWPDSKLNPGSMGFYNHLSFMECYSQVCAIDGTIDEGHLKINDRTIDFTGGKLYIEKNWGKSFPSSWLWIQSNSFTDNRATVTCSLATIPFPILKEFQGFLIGVTVDNQFYPFTTINRSKMSLDIHDDDILLVTTHKHLKLTLKTKTNPNEFVLCYGPKDGTMIPLVEETITASVEMTLEDTKKNTIIYQGIGHATGVEYGGEFMKTKGESGV